jgi:hypothetical protein
MKDSLSHLPQIKTDELELIAFNIRALCHDAQMPILSAQNHKEKQLFDLPHYAYVGVRYDHHYKITKQQLERLNPCARKLHEVTERICVAKIKSFV